ncbi:MAG TPA: condensation domain-containing protein, partial [Actinomycetota bacterium]|nr:condensation domain-containing protein [Actinomycetota bacterium]
MWLTGSLFNQIADSDPMVLGTPHTIIAGGEPLSVEHVRRHRQRHPSREFLNGYGPTEATTFTTSFRIDASILDDDVVSVPIGRPIANTSVYLLDRYLQPVPVGVAGELYIGGVGLARGYLGRPGLTAERFVPNPFGVPGSRLYRSGDLGRYLADGNIEFLGRLDDQVKIRGFRIELGEVEAALSQHPEVRETVVVAREDSPGERRLVAYVVGSGVEVDVDLVPRLRTFLRERLPDYMVPAAFVALDALPLTTNGKVDRKALPVPEGRPDTGVAYVAPRTPTEEVLAAIWSQVLGVDEVGVEDNFFDLGGHSLLATQVVSRVRSSFGVDVALRRFFEYPSIEELARAVEVGLRADAGLAVPPLVAVPRDGPVELSFAQQRLWFLDQLVPANPFYNVASAYRLEGGLEVGCLERALTEVVARHEALRTTFPSEDGRPRQVVGPAFEVALDVVDLVALSDEARDAELRRLVDEEAARPFDLATGPLLRLGLIRLDATDHVLLVTMHHIVSDGWSMGIFQRELSTLYDAFARGQESPLAALPIQYADFAVWQRRWLVGDALDAQLSYWREQLEGLEPLELPTDRPRPVIPSYRGAVVPFELSQPVTEALLALGRREGTTLFMTLLAAFKAVLARYTGQDDIAVGSPIANRTRAETEDLIGFFVNTLVLRTDCSGDPSFVELLGRVRETALGAYTHQDLPFEQLVEDLQPTRDLSRNPLVQVSFQLLNTPMRALTFGDVEGIGIGQSTATTRFDVEFYILQTPVGLQGQVVFSTELFDAGTVERMLGHFRTLLGSVAVDPDRPLSELSLLENEERERLLVEWNDTAAEFPADDTLAAIFEDRVAQNPDAVAVIFDGVSLSYAELNARANRLAHRLRRVGVRSETVVGLCLERGLDAVVAVVAVLKAGGAYLPIDPDYPDERVRFLIRDAAAAVVIAHADRLADRLAEMVSVSGRAPVTIAVEDHLADESDDNPDRVTTADNLAYVIYTSGSTGAPKGVMVTNRSVVNYISWTARAYALDSAMALVSSPLAFDFTVTTLLGPLLSGGRAVIVGARLEDASQVGPASVLKLTPSHARVLGERIAPDVGQSLETLIVGGEGLVGRDVVGWRERFP